MKFEIDFDKKTITVSNNVNLKDFFEKLEECIDNWGEYELITNVTFFNNLSRKKELPQVSPGNPFGAHNPYDPLKRIPNTNGPIQMTDNSKFELIKKD